MAGMTDYLATNLLQYMTGKAAMPAMANAYIGLFNTAPTTDAGMTGAAEVTGTNYARVQTIAANWSTATASSGTEPSVVPAFITNAQTISFATAGVGGWGTIPAWGLFDALTTGNLIAWDYLGPFDWVPFACSLAGPGIFNSPGHGYSNGDNVILTSKFGGTLPSRSGSWAGLQTVAGVSGDTFNLGVTTTSTGDGAIRKVAPQVIAQSGQLIFGIGSLKLSAA